MALVSPSCFFVASLLLVCINSLTSHKVPWSDFAGHVAMQIQKGPFLVLNLLRLNFFSHLRSEKNHRLLYLYFVTVRMSEAEHFSSVLMFVCFIVRKSIH